MRVCARVLAAALMTGAIAGAFALPSLLGQGVDEPRALPAPPSVKLRTLHLPAFTAPAQHTIAVRHHVAHRAPTRSALIAVRIAPTKVHRTTVFHTAASAGRSGLPSRAPAPSPAPAPKPAPAPSPAPSTPPERELAATSQPAPPAPVTPPAAPDDQESHGNGHAYGHYKQADGNGQGQDNGNGQGNGKGNGHKK